MSEFVRCLPVQLQPWGGQIVEAATLAGVPAPVLAGLVMKESAGDQHATNVAEGYATDLAGEYAAGTLDPRYVAAINRGWTTRELATSIGLAMVEGTTAVADLGFGGSYEDLFAPRVNLRLGARYLARMIGEFPDLQTALAAYNAGPTRVRNGTAPASSFDDYAATILRTANAITACWKP